MLRMDGPSPPSWDMDSKRVVVVDWTGSVWLPTAFLPGSDDKEAKRESDRVLLAGEKAKEGLTCQEAARCTSASFEVACNNLMM